MERRCQTYASDGSSDDESRRSRGDRADQRSNLEDEDGAEIGKLDVKELVDGAVHGLQSGGREKVCGSVPALWKCLSLVHLICVLLLSPRLSNVHCLVKDGANKS